MSYRLKQLPPPTTLHPLRNKRWRCHIEDWGFGRAGQSLVDGLATLCLYTHGHCIGHGFRVHDPFSPDRTILSSSFPPPVPLLLGFAPRTCRIGPYAASVKDLEQGDGTSDSDLSIGFTLLQMMTGSPSGDPRLSLWREQSKFQTYNNFLHYAVLGDRQVLPKKPAPLQSRWQWESRPTLRLKRTAGQSCWDSRFHQKTNHVLSYLWSGTACILSG
ncbi:hypothetical protein B0H67DRAFT_248493 [Lasiosphaeris hirsuta]|uniref:Uncharacterized protein n=1 Tax=Lasiosphaeris hirsuta TaxID=260670 RepID=A0AA40DXX9_9PEZI|nr:hypothetical protein B0H67DRAFT_248493 [Lasiosphaeris hirsuta]